MDTLGWNTLLFALKWVFIGLIYFVLVFVVLAVRREMGVRVKTRPPEASFSAGRLKVLSSGSDTRLRSGAILDLHPVTSLGSQADNDIVLRDRFISRYHARLRWDGVDWWVEDLSSRNGTFLNSEPVMPDTPRQLTNGATLTLGEMAFQLIE